MNAASSAANTPDGSGLPEQHKPQRRMAEMRFPADKEHLALARTTAMHVAGLLDLPLSRVTDLRLAVDEACTAFLTAGRITPADTLELRYELLPDRLCISVRGPVPSHWPEVDEVGWSMLQALVSEVHAETVDGIGILTLVELLRRPVG